MLVEVWGGDRRVAGDLFERLDIRELQIAGMTEIPQPVQAPGLSFDLGTADRLSAVLGKNTESLKALRDAMERAGGAAEVLRDSFRKNLAASLDGATLFGRPVKLSSALTREVADVVLAGVDKDGRAIEMRIPQAMVTLTLTRG